MKSAISKLETVRWRPLSLAYIIGLPDDITDLISVWLGDRSFYVCVNGLNSTLYDLLLGTVQGSVLGPALCLQGC